MLVGGAGVVGVAGVGDVVDDGVAPGGGLPGDGLGEVDDRVLAAAFLTGFPGLAGAGGRKRAAEPSGAATIPAMTNASSMRIPFVAVSCVSQNAASRLAGIHA